MSVHMFRSLDLSLLDLLRAFVKKNEDRRTNLLDHPVELVHHCGCINRNTVRRIKPHLCILASSSRVFLPTPVAKIDSEVNTLFASVFLRSQLRIPIAVPLGVSGLLSCFVCQIVLAHECFRFPQRLEDTSTVQNSQIYLRSVYAR